MKLPLLLGGLAACSFTHGSLTSDGSVVDDGRVDTSPLVDARIDAVVGTNCFGAPTGNFRICLTNAQLPTQPYSPPTNFQTSQCTSLGGFMVQQNTGPDVCVRAGTTVTVSGPVMVTGPNPLVLLSTGDMTINALIEVTAGANWTGCTASGVGDGSAAGAGGGAGGSFGTAGNRGGVGHSGAGNTAGGAAAGATGQPILSLRGGCSGAAGGYTLTGGGGAGGNGGGAIYLLSAGYLMLNSPINASGRGGIGGPVMKGGGGGGGSGGMIVVHTNTLTGAGALAANGGGGGEGADNNTTGMSGAAGSALLIAAPGGDDPSSTGGAGGAGAAGSTPAGVGFSSGEGGGGGGGGLGVIRFLSGQNHAGIMSPPPS